MRRPGGREGSDQDQGVNRFGAPDGIAAGTGFMGRTTNSFATFGPL